MSISQLPRYYNENIILSGGSLMEARKENWKYFRHGYPEAHEAYEAFGKALGSDNGPLDAKTCALVKLGIAAASQYDLALRSHIEKALAAGCTPDEVEHAILQTATTAGFPRMMAALMIWREEKIKL
jgi:4-carboxymuconolactone decarboxylase